MGCELRPEGCLCPRSSGLRLDKECTGNVCCPSWDAGEWGFWGWMLLFSLGGKEHEQSSVVHGLQTLLTPLRQHPGQGQVSCAALCRRSMGSCD